jgi:hypothetical protein
MAERYISDYGIVDIYKFYKKNQIEKGLPVIDESVFRKILKYHNSEICKSIVENSDEFRMPYRLGYIRIRKYKTRLKLDADGKLITSHLKPDWKATKELWRNNEEAKENKKIVYHTNKHTGSFYFKWFWDKRTCNIRNSSVYSILMSRANKRSIAQAVKNNEKLDYYE